MGCDWKLQHVEMLMLDHIAAWLVLRLTDGSALRLGLQDGKGLCPGLCDIERLGLRLGLRLSDTLLLGAPDRLALDPSTNGPKLPGVCAE